MKVKDLIEYLQSLDEPDFEVVVLSPYYDTHKDKKVRIIVRQIYEWEVE